MNHEHERPLHEGGREEGPHDGHKHGEHERHHGEHEHHHHGPWKLNVQGVIIESHSPEIAVRQAIKQAGFNPDTPWIIVLKVAGEPKREVDLSFVIDLRHKGIEKLRLTPRQINNGEMAAGCRVEFALLPQDVKHLDQLGLRWETLIDGGRRWLILRNYPLSTGSIVVEQLARLGVGEIILIDFDKLEERNLNRILNSSLAEIGLYKVEMFANAIRLYRPDCDVVALPRSIATPEAILAACEADLLFSCVDTAEGRHIADRLSAYFAMPLFDVGVAIPTEAAPRGGRRIAEVYGRVDYVYPGGSSLMDRGVYDAALLEAEYLARVAPQALSRKIAYGYLRGIPEEAPGVIALNMRAASACVIEFLARLFPFRQFPNEMRARSIFMLAEGDEDTFAENQFAATRRFPVASGVTDPLLGLPALADQRRVA
jgi:hypothetical protein